MPRTLAELKTGLAFLRKLAKSKDSAISRAAKRILARRQREIDRRRRRAKG